MWRYSCLQLPNRQAVKPLVGEYIDVMAHTVGIESFLSLPKRVYLDTFQRLAPSTFKAAPTRSPGGTNSGPEAPCTDGGYRPWLRGHEAAAGGPDC